jgi:transposase
VNVAGKYRTQEYRFLLRLARQLVIDRPGITGGQMAHELGLSRTQGYEWLRRVRNGVTVEDPVELTRDYLKRYPTATLKGIAALLGVSLETARQYKKQALERRPVAAPGPEPTMPRPVATSENTYDIPRFKDLKEI